MRHSGVQETCHVLRASAAERALTRLQKENDELKGSIIGYKKQQHSLYGVVNRLRSELEAMGKTVMEQNATLSSFSYAFQRHDPCHLIKERLKTKTLRQVHGDESSLDRVEALQMEREILQKESNEKNEIISNLKKLLSKAQESQKRIPETIDAEESDVPQSLGSCETVRQETNATGGLQRMIAALNRLLDNYEGFCQPANALGQLKTGDDAVAEDEIFTVCIRILSCADLTYPRDFDKDFNSRLYVVVCGPFGRNVLFQTPPEMANTAFPMFSGSPLNNARFRVTHDTFGRLELEVWIAKSADITTNSVLFGRTSVPVNALLSNVSKSSRPPSPSTVEDGQFTSLYTMKLFDPSKELQVVGEICFEVEIHRAQSAGRLSMASIPLVKGPISDSTNPKTTAEAKKTKEETTQPAKAAMSLSPGSSKTASYHEISRVSSDSTASPNSVADHVSLSRISKMNSVPLEADPEVPIVETEATEPLKLSSEVLNAQPSSSVSLYIYIKEGYRFKEIREDDILEELADYRTRVLVWIDGQLVFTVPEARSNLRMRWSSEDAAFITTVDPRRTICFEVQAIRGDFEKDSIGEASVKVFDVFSPTKRSIVLKLPVMLNGVECGSLVVEFCKSSK
ncbi:unnamed protein product [Phytomonas sp. Hart1]|nr:unnamed protein product [Phytomonas sp. Hart1]|eukprot:CCW67058.1 unnamed protein product [Phytomonas sp. isolate Hart1]